MLDPNWVNALKLPTKVISGLFIASIVVLLIDKLEVIEISKFGELARPVIIILCVVSGALTLTAFISFFVEMFNVGKKRTLLEQRRILKKSEQEEKVKARNETVLARIPHLSQEELHYLANCIKENSQSFTAYVYSPYTSTLMSKGLIFTPGGQHNQDYYPFIINDFVWLHLLENRDSILEKDKENKKIKAEKEKRGR